MSEEHDYQPRCPLPAASGDRIVLAHGGGGRMTRDLIRKVMYGSFGNPLLRDAHDGAVLPLPGARLAFTTDSYVVRPLFFPGGDIGRLAVYGTVNDLAMCGAKPRYLSVGFILEEGLPLETLERIVHSMAEAARATEVSLVTGDTKVVDRGKGDGVYVNTSGVGVIPDGVAVGPRRVRPGDRVILSGSLGAHGIAVLSVREGVQFGGGIESDLAPLHGAVARLLGRTRTVTCLRDLTRGGLASALNEIAEAAELSISVDEAETPVREGVRGACELLGLDPFYVANEGRFVAFVPPEQADAAVAALRTHPVSAEARVIGEVTPRRAAPVLLRTAFGTSRVLDLLSGEQMPRIC